MFGHGLQTCFYPESVGIACTVRFFVRVATLLLHLCRATSKDDKNEIRPRRCFAFYTRAARLLILGGGEGLALPHRHLLTLGAHAQRGLQYLVHGAPGVSSCPAQRGKAVCSPVYLLMLPVCEKLALLTGIHRVGPCPIETV